MTAAATMPMKWASNIGSIDQCACCGRKLRGEPRWVEVINGGSDVAAPGLDPDTTDPGYMGFFPVGAGCAKKHFPGFTQPSATTPPA